MPKIKDVHFFRALSPLSRPIADSTHEISEIAFLVEYDVPLLMTVPNAFGAESFDGVDPLITHPVWMEGGFAFPTQRSGWGFEFKQASLVEIST